MVKKSQLAIDTRSWRDPAVKPFVRIKNVTKKFGDIHAMADVLLDIYKSELFCLLSGSGSGKSTLLRMLGGEQPAPACRPGLGQASQAAARRALGPAQ
ncbi:MAG: hypothetical protein MO846_06730 [Candidatus Devosia symbiotica]|nr:hypothetical protein [Candidatus Devosia symbiotica]